MGNKNNSNRAMGSSSSGSNGRQYSSRSMRMHQAANTTQRPHQYNTSRSTSSSISPPTAPSNSGQFRFEWNNKSNPNKKSTKQNNENRNNNKQFGGFGGGASSNSSYQFGTNGNARSGSNDLSHSNT